MTYVPEDIHTDYIQTQLWQLDNDGDIKSDEASHALKMHLRAVEHYEDAGAPDKVAKHMKGFNKLLLHQKNIGQINDKAYDKLKASADSMIN